MSPPLWSLPGSSQVETGLLPLYSLGSLFIKPDCPWHLAVISRSCTCFITPLVTYPTPPPIMLKGAGNRSQSSLNGIWKQTWSLISIKLNLNLFTEGLYSSFKIIIVSLNLLPSTLSPPKLVMYVVCFKSESQKGSESNKDTIWSLCDPPPPPKEKQILHLYQSLDILFLSPPYSEHPFCPELPAVQPSSGHPDFRLGGRHHWLVLRPTG